MTASGHQNKQNNGEEKATGHGSSSERNGRDLQKPGETEQTNKKMKKTGQKGGAETVKKTSTKKT